MNNFSHVIAWTMSFLGITAFAKDKEGKSCLLSEQEKQLSKKWGDAFLTQFKADLTEFEKDGQVAESAVTETVKITAAVQQSEDKKLLKELQAEVKLLKQANEKMAKEPAGDMAVEIEKDGSEMKTVFKPDMKLAMNAVYMAAAAPGSSWTGDTTIDTEELKQEFGRYVSSEKYAIFQKLIGSTTSLQYMSTIITDKFEVRASQAILTSVLQSFTPQWTPKGKAKFTPLTIRQYPMKINVEVYPSDIINDILGYLYDESLEPKDMPIVRYIVEQLVKPKLDEEREIAFAMGRYKEPELGEDGKFKSNDANEVCNGYLTTLCDLKRAGNTDVSWLFDGKELGSGAQLVTNIEAAVDEVAPLYKKKKLTIHADPDLILKYSRAYRDKYPNTKNQDGENIAVDYTKFTFAGLDGMQGTGAFFITPKENFKHIMSRNPKDMGLRMKSEDYFAKVFGEWREGIGFWIAEAIFAYIPTDLLNKLAPVAESGSKAGSGSESGEGGL